MTAEHILVVDDEPDIRSLLKEILDDEGYEVSAAANGEEARQARRSVARIWCCWISGCRISTALRCSRNGRTRRAACPCRSS